MDRRKVLFIALGAIAVVAIASACAYFLLRGGDDVERPVPGSIASESSSSSSSGNQGMFENTHVDGTTSVPGQDVSSSSYSGSASVPDGEAKSISSVAEADAVAGDLAASVLNFADHSIASDILVGGTIPQEYATDENMLVRISKSGIEQMYVFNKYEDPQVVSCNCVSSSGGRYRYVIEATAFLPETRLPDGSIRDAGRRTFAIDLVLDGATGKAVFFSLLQE